MLYVRVCVRCVSLSRIIASNVFVSGIYGCVQCIKAHSLHTCFCIAYALHFRCVRFKSVRNAATGIDHIDSHDIFIVQSNISYMHEECILH